MFRNSKKKPCRKGTHVWEWERGRCPGEETRRCGRCEQKEAYDPHTWGVWQYESPMTCQQLRYCLVCFEKEVGALIHKWSLSPYYFDENNIPIFVCTHCKETGASEEADRYLMSHEYT
ncbi:MAG: hypothetical protein GFH27_549431n34 [Chloroflexi bacterium AL-W]|nr:hypothetical protein [Chloroflexi bacterium AL-N1]NOK71638.1 hypothetical protein [Chloroflexi bacterium AL-N10]NOK78938.1 hypothetical protein [Chloroflexi bacterium AL-N5]NOK86413.1 hypothetical protein [Chloroflexi bacterium AL-W]